VRYMVTLKSTSTTYHKWKVEGKWRGDGKWRVEGKWRADGE